jgi:hypothetical protein
MRTVWNVLTIRCTRKLLKRLGAEAIVDPPSPTNRLGNWYAKLVFVRHVPLIICISERSLLPVIVQARGAASFSARFRDAARSVLQGIGAGPDWWVHLFAEGLLPRQKLKVGHLLEVEAGRVGRLARRIGGSFGSFLGFLFGLGLEVGDRAPSVATSSRTLISRSSKLSSAARRSVGEATSCSIESARW